MFAAALGMTSCLQRACTDAGCTSGISVKIVGVLPVEPALARMCLDDVCTDVPWPVGGSACETVESKWRSSLCLQDDGSFIQLIFRDDASARDGVKFELIVSDSEGNALLHEDENVRFSDSYPNGKRCPGHCKYANYRY